MQFGLCQDAKTRRLLFRNRAIVSQPTRAPDLLKLPRSRVLYLHVREPANCWSGIVRPDQSMLLQEITKPVICPISQRYSVLQCKS